MSAVAELHRPIPIYSSSVWGFALHGISRQDASLKKTISVLSSFMPDLMFFQCGKKKLISYFYISGNKGICELRFSTSSFPPCSTNASGQQFGFLLIDLQSFIIMAFELEFWKII